MKKYPKWHDEVIRKNYPTMGSQIVDLIPGRGINSIGARARRLGLNVIPGARDANRSQSGAGKKNPKLTPEPVPAEIVELATRRPWR